MIHAIKTLTIDFRGSVSISSHLLPVRKVTITALLLFAILSFANAQSSKLEASYEPLIYFEADPFAYFNKGYSVHLGYENWGFRFDLTKVRVDFPEAYESAFYGTKAFDLVTNINGIKVDYIGNRQNWTKNAFVGLDINHQRLSFAHRESLAEQDLNTWNVGLRAGYKIPIYKGFYVTPWAAVWKNVSKQQEFSVGNDLVTTNEWDWITTLHFGYAIRI